MTHSPGGPGSQPPGPGGWFDRLPVALLLGILIVVGAVVRTWSLGSIGLNSDEAVYSGQAAALAGNPTYGGLFQVFRAHPLLVQFLVSLVFRVALDDTLARMVAVLFGVAAIPLAYATGSLLYGRRVGLVAAAIIALMPYHVFVSRQILLDAPMTTLFLLTIYCLARFIAAGDARWLYATAIAGGLAFLAKETAVLVVPTAAAMVLVIPEIRLRPHQVVIAAILFLVALSPYPAAIAISGATDTARQFLVWQLLRNPNHTWTFYGEVLPGAMGVLVLLLALFGLVILLRTRRWQDRLMVVWVLVPAAFFEAWPVKGYQYLLPIAPAVAISAGVGLTALPGLLRRFAVPRTSLVTAAATIVLLLSLAVPTVAGVTTITTRGSLAGTGGLPGGREAGLWIRSHVPEGATFMTIGPTMSNIVRFYGQRPAFGVSVSPNPLRRNPAYDPIRNPDRSIQLLKLQYAVVDVWSADRSPFFANVVRRYVEKYHGNLIYEQHAQVRGDDDRITDQVVIQIYEVRP
jgi:4-amino-4-deoxy-L-arabinose transferase-like glycosyltransferase